MELFSYILSQCSLLVYKNANDFSIDFISCYLAITIVGVYEFFSRVFWVF
jgi:hypothetical protein